MKFVVFIIIALTTLYSVNMSTISVDNMTKKPILGAKIWLSNTALDFDALNKDKGKSIDYSPFYGSGTFKYEFHLADGSKINGKCGAYEAMVFNKTDFFFITKNKVIHRTNGQNHVCKVFGNK